MRVSPTSDSLLNTLGYARKLNTDWTFLTKTIFYGVENNGASDGTKIQSRFQTGLAYRQELEDRLDRLCSSAWTLLGEENTRTFLDLVEPVGHVYVARIDATAGPNWMPAARDREPRP